MAGGSAVAFGGLFLATGLGIAVPAALGAIEMSSGVPQWIGVVAGSLFALAGLAVVVSGVRDLRSMARARELREHHAAEPWVWDHRWDARSSSDDSAMMIRRALAFTGVIALFAAVANGIGFLTPERPLPFRISAVCMDLFLGGTVWWSVYLIARRAKYGEARVRFGRFPFLVGGEVEVVLIPSRVLARVPRLDATLRCVQERYETTRDSDGSRSTKVVSYEVWSSEPARGEVRRGELGWRFQVPAGLPGTALSERPPRYWELEVKGEAPGIDYAGAFLVPVYAAVDRREARRAVG